MFELFIILILVIITKAIVQKAKYIYKIKKEHRKLMKLFWDNYTKPPPKVVRGLKRFYRKSGFKPNKSTLEGLGMLKYPKLKRTTRVIQFNLLFMPIFMTVDFGLLLIPIIFGASEMFDWAVDIKKLPPCCRPIVRNNNGYWFNAMIRDDNGDVFIIESRNGGDDWGNNHTDYNNGTGTQLNQGANEEFCATCDYDTISLAVTDDNKMHIFAISPDYRGANHLFTYTNDSNADINDMAQWRGYNANAPPNADWVTYVGDATYLVHSGTLVAHGNLISCVWSQKRMDQTNQYEILYRHRSSTLLDTDGGTWGAIRTVTASSASHNQYPCMVKDSNNHFHVAWRNDNGDNSIKYAHAHSDNTDSWYQSDNVSLVTTGESGETIMTEAGKNFNFPSICTNALPDYLDDIWVSGYLAVENELYTIQYDKSGAAWQAKAKISGTDQVDSNGQLGTSADGNVRAVWSLVTVGGIRGCAHDGTAWGSIETLQT